MLNLYSVSMKSVKLTLFSVGVPFKTGNSAFIYIYILVLAGISGSSTVTALKTISNAYASI